MADRFDNTTKTMAILAVIFFVLLIILFFVLEFRFLKKIMVEYEDNIQRIVLSETYSFMHELEFYTDTTAKRLSGEDSLRDRKLLGEIAAENPRVIDALYLNEHGYVRHSLRGPESYLYPVSGFKQAAPGSPFLFCIVERGRVDELCVASAVDSQSGADGYLLVTYRINDLQQKFILKYATQKLKIALVDNAGNPLVWPFAEDMITILAPDRDSFTADNVRYSIQQAELDKSNINVLFFHQDTHFDTYRIIAIMFLLFALYFLIYHFIVEFFKINNVNSYFENIDFNIFNHLQEGIIIANNAGRLVFANSEAYKIFAGKRIETGKTVLSELIGPLEGQNGRLTLKKSDDLLEIILSPIIKNGRQLGSLAVIGPDSEREKLCHNAMGRVFEHLVDGLVFVDRECKIVASNMMARYYLGNLQDGMNLGEINTELMALVEKHIGSSKPIREKLAWSDAPCELLPVFDGNGLYAGTIIFIKNETGYC